MMKKHGIELKPGSHIVGRWHKNKYTIKRKLGAGTVGNVYLCRSEDRLLAMKISKQMSSITTEGNVLQELNKVQDRNLGPYLFDIDDWSLNGELYSFYIMEYIEGVAFDSFVKSRGYEWIGVLMMQLLHELEALHQYGWVFGDLKIENLLVMSDPVRVRFVDVGGTTQIGRSIKEHTDFFDRGYWGLGSREAEPSYDLFALAMVFVAIYHPKHFLKGKSPQRTIFQKINQTKELKPYENLLKKAVRGEYPSSIAMEQDLISLLNDLQGRKRAHGKKDRLPFYIESVGISIIAILYFLSAKLFF